MTVSVCNCGKLHMIKNDGSLWHGPFDLQSDLEKRGWRTVVNPKRTYYPEFDVNSSIYREQIVFDPNEDTDLLQIEII